MLHFFDLHHHILVKVASYLTASDAISLACSHSLLQDIGESRIRHTLDFDVGTGRRDMNEPLAVKARLHLVSEAASELAPGKVDLLQGAMEYLSLLLRARPQRQLFVREIRVVCQRYHWDGMEHIEWDGIRLGGSWEDWENQRGTQWLRTQKERLTSGPISHSSPAKTFAKFPILPTVRTLHLELAESWEEYVEAWQKLTPDVQDPSFQVISSVRRLPPPTRPLHPWTQLTSLRIQKLSSDTAPLFTTLLRANPYLRSVEVDSWDWNAKESSVGHIMVLSDAISDIERSVDLKVPEEMMVKLLEQRDFNRD